MSLQRISGLIFISPLFECVDVFRKIGLPLMFALVLIFPGYVHSVTLTPAMSTSRFLSKCFSLFDDALKVYTVANDLDAEPGYLLAVPLLDTRTTRYCSRNIHVCVFTTYGITISGELYKIVSDEVVSNLIDKLYPVIDVSSPDNIMFVCTKVQDSKQVSSMKAILFSGDVNYVSFVAM